MINLMTYLAIVILVNIIGFFFGYSKGGWAQLGLVMFLAPIYEVVLLIAGIIMLIRMTKKYPENDYGIYWLVVISSPIVLYIATAILTFAFPTGNGC